MKLSGTFGIVVGLMIALPPQASAELRDPYGGCGVATVGWLVGYKNDITKTYLKDPPLTAQVYAAHDLNYKAVGTFESQGEWTIGTTTYDVYKILSGFSVRSDWCDGPTEPQPQPEDSAAPVWELVCAEFPEECPN